MDSKPKDFFSQFINWFSELGDDQAPIRKEEENQDFFSRLMNHISG